MTQLRTGLRWGLGLLVAVGQLGMTGGASGQAPPDHVARMGEVKVVTPSYTRTFGTASQTALVISAPEFDPVIDTATWVILNQAAGPLTKTSNNNLYASVRLPAGAVVTSVELEGCDTDSAIQLSFVLIRVPSPEGPLAQVTPIGLTGDMPGCAFFSVTPLPVFTPLVIENENNLYYLRVFAPNANTTVTAVRVYYTLQVSPAPAVATFGDVPTSHPFFRFIEALVASGITSGCGGGNYCPDAPLTRGQMAVFLSLGLGLHFAP